MEHVKDMAEESSSPLKEMGSLVPSVYYDVIARICPGALFVTVIIWDRTQAVKDLEEAIGVPILGLLILLVSYTAGLLLTVLSFLPNWIARVIWSAFSTWKHRNDARDQHREFIKEFIKEFRKELFSTSLRRTWSEGGTQKPVKQLPKWKQRPSFAGT
ncbi:MAG TPA: hypothetical protein VI756_08260 [Blastocatellia bacterium]